MKLGGGVEGRAERGENEGYIHILEERKERGKEIGQKKGYNG